MIKMGGFRSIIIANPARLSADRERLVIDTWEKTYIPMEDIRCLMLENRQITLTSSLLSRLGDMGIPVFACSGTHLPSSVFYPINCHSRQLKQLRLQMQQSLPFEKRMWQQAVVSKINNQAVCLELCENPKAENLKTFAKAVRPGDPENLEGRAAAAYFKALFGKDYTRGQENHTNALLNYGYSIFRGMIARTLAVYGFEPCLGIHHSSELNNFNLADDFLEPFRPIVDLFAVKNRWEGATITTGEKAALLDLINVQVLSGGERHSASYAIERLVQSYTACLNKEKNSLTLPTLKGLERHGYD